MVIARSNTIDWLEANLHVYFLHWSGRVVLRSPKYTTVVWHAYAKQVIWYVSCHARGCSNIVVVLSSIAKLQAMQHPWTINLLLPGSATFVKGARMSNSCPHLTIPSKNSCCFLRQPTTLFLICVLLLKTSWKFYKFIIPGIRKNDTITRNRNH